MMWIAVDWGSSNLRAWLMRDADALETANDASAGANALERGAFEPALAKLIAPWRDRAADVMICGVAGSREGWREAPYGQVPCKVADLAPTSVATDDPGLRAFIMPGLSQTNPRAAILRGEETQIRGFLASHTGFDGVICLPGTHTKWVHISAEEVVSFDSALTGEVFGLLARTSILRHSVRAGDWRADAFDAGLSRVLSRPECLVAEIAALRADDVLNGADKVSAHARLSGLLIGAEIAAMKPYWLGQQVVLIGADHLCDVYAHALSLQGVATQKYDAAAMTQAGLFAAYKSLGTGS